MKRSQWLQIGWLLLCPWAAAQPATVARGQPNWLPDATQVERVLAEGPVVRSARWHYEAQRQRARGVESGPGEWTIRLSRQQRKANETPAPMAEGFVTLERPLRLWGKAGLDAQLADHDRDVARLALAEAWHEASRQLLQQWSMAMRARMELGHAERVSAVAQELHSQAQARLKNGEVSQLDASLAEAEWRRCMANLSLAQSEWVGQQTQLHRLYPGLIDPQWPVGTEPSDARQANPLEPWSLEGFLRHHHELNLRRAEAQRQRQYAERVERDRWPDPTVGVFSGRERAGAEQLMGVSVSIPLSGTYRDSQAKSAQADAHAAQDRVELLTRQLSADFESRVAATRLSEQAWVAVRQAAATQNLAAQKSRLAYVMGEQSMTELLQNQRLAHEQNLARDRLQLDVWTAQALLALDSHRLWDLEP